MLRHALLPPLLIVAAGLLAYGGALDAAFQFDDFPAVVENPVLEGPWRFGEVLERSAAGADYVRPVLFLSYRLTERLATPIAARRGLADDDLAARSVAHHTGNLVLHLLNALLVLYWARALTARTGSDAGEGRNRAPEIAALLFAVHPALSQGVYYVAARSTVLCTTFVLAAALLALRAATAGREARRVRLYLAGSLLCTTAALLTKEIAVVTPLLIAACIALGGEVDERRWRWRWLAPHAFLCVTALILWSQLSAAHHQPPVLDYAVMQIRAVARYAGLLLWPHALRIDYGWVPPPLTALWPGSAVFDGAHLRAVLGGLVLLAGIGAVAGIGGRRRPLIRVGVAWFAIALLPTSSIFPIRDPIFEHRLILGAPGFLLVIADCCVGLWGVVSRRCSGAAARRGAGIALIALLLVTVALLARQSHQRGRDWRSETALWRSNWQWAPDNPRAAFNLAAAITADFDRSSGERPRQPADETLFAETEALYRAALRLHPEYAYGYELRSYAATNLGYLYMNTAGNEDSDAPAALDRAVAVLDTATTYRVRAGAREVPYPQAWANLGLALMRRAGLRRTADDSRWIDDVSRAVEALTTAAEMDPTQLNRQRLLRAQEWWSQAADPESRRESTATPGVDR